MAYITEFKYIYIFLIHIPMLKLLKEILMNIIII